MLWLIKSVFGFLGGSTVNGLANNMRQAYEAKLQAQTQEDVLNAEHDMARLENAMLLAQIANEDRWSATSLGRYLVVLPFGVWWAMTYLDSTFIFEWDTLELPAYIQRMTEWLVPAIIIGDVGKSATNVFRSRRLTTRNR